MTILLISKSHNEIAISLDDETLSDMIKEITMILTKTHIFCRGGKFSDWALKCKSNYLYIISLGLILLDEYQWRFSEMCKGCKTCHLKGDHYLSIKSHPEQETIEFLYKNIPNIENNIVKHPIFSDHYITTMESDGYCNLCLDRNDGTKSGCGDWIWNLVTNIPLCMPKKFKELMKNDFITGYDCYRSYYISKISNLTTIVPIWTRREKPHWIISDKIK